MTAQERPDWCVDPAFIAVFDNDIESLREFINNGGDVRAHDDNDICHSLLSFAIVLGRKQAVDMLIDAGADVNEELMLERDHWMSNEPCEAFQPCHLAAMQPDEAIVKALIAANADLSAIDGNQSSVCHIAAENTNEQVMVALLDAGAQPDALDLGSWTPIHVAASNPNADVMKALIKALRSDIVDELIDWEEKGAIHLAAKNPNASVLKVILDAGANVELTGICGNTACHFAADREEHLAALLEHKCNVNARNDAGLTPCHEAAARGTVACLSMMLAAGGDVCSVCDDDRTLLHYAAKNQDESVLKIVIEAMGATSNDALKSRSKFGQTPLHYAAANPNVNVTAMLLRLDTSTVALESRNDELATPLLVAAESGSIAVVQALLAAGACTTVVDDELNSLCHRGAKNSDRAVISLILTLPCVNKDAVNRNGSTPCHVALLARNFDCANVLIDAGANVNAVDHSGTTIGHLMAQQGTADQLRMLLRRGVDIRAKDGCGRSICDYANANAGCLALLFAIGADMHDRNRLEPIYIAMHAKEQRDSFYVLHAAGIELSASSIQLLKRANRTLGTDEDELQHIAKAQVRLIVLRGFEVCTGLQSFRLPALVTCEILAHAFAPRENCVPFHILWKIVTTCKHFK